MNAILRPSWWIQTIMSTIITMIFIYLIKKVTERVNIPVISNVAQEV